MTTDYTNMATSAFSDIPYSFIVFYFFIVVCAIISYVGMWKMFQKAKKPGWASIVPIYNYYCMFDIAVGHGWLCLFLLVPKVRFLILIYLVYKLSKSYGHGIGYCIGLLFLQPIFFMLLGFGDATYIGPQ